MTPTFAGVGFMILWTALGLLLLPEAWAELKDSAWFLLYLAFPAIGPVFIAGLYRICSVRLTDQSIHRSKHDDPTARLEPVVEFRDPRYVPRTTQLSELGRFINRRGMRRISRTVDELRALSGLEATPPRTIRLRASCG